MVTVAAPPPHLSRRTVVLTLLLVLLALCLRLGFLHFVMSQAGFAFGDPDRYLANGASLATPEGFRWRFRAVHYPWGNRLYVLPPLYPFTLGLVALLPGFPLNAAIGQIALNSLAIVAIVAIGARTHSTRAGLIAGLLFALWGSNIVGVRNFMQEALYVPLVIVMFLALVRAFDRRSPGRFFVAGLALGLATLCRSMPIYYTAVVALGHVALARPRRPALVEAAALLAGFAVLTVPYSVALSLHLDAPTFVENHGGIFVAHRFGAGKGAVPGLTSVIVALVSEFARDPGAFTIDTLDRARSLLHVSGGRWLEQAVDAPTAAVAQASKIFAHATIDLPLVLTALLAAPGLVFMRNRAAAALIGSWIALNVALVSITGFGGARLRSPFEPHLMLLAGVVLGGGWATVSRARLTAAAAVGALAALAVVPQIPRTLRARANYGVEWARPAPPHVATIRGRAGFNVLLAARGVLTLDLQNPGPEGQSVRIAVQGAEVARLQIPAHEQREFRLVQPGLALAYVEVDGASPAGMVVHVPGR